MGKKAQKKKQFRRFWQDGDETPEEFENRKLAVLAELDRGNVVMESAPFKYNDVTKVVVDDKGRAYPEKPWKAADRGRFRTLMAFEILPGEEFKGEIIKAGEEIESRLG
jgi:hypothetical protein